MHHMDRPEAQSLFDGDLRLLDAQCRKIIFVAQREPDGLDFRGRAAAEISDGAMFDLAVFAIRLPQQIAGVGFGALAGVGDVDVHGGYESP